MSFGQAASVIYPDDFPGSSPLSPGTYKVEWREGAADSPRSSVIETLGYFAMPPIAVDSFRIAGAATGGQHDIPRPTEATSGEKPVSQADTPEQPTPAETESSDS